MEELKKNIALGK